MFLERRKYNFKNTTEILMMVIIILFEFQENNILATICLLTKL